VTEKPRRSLPLLCPSAQPEQDGAVAFGVVGGTPEEPLVRPLERPLPVTTDLLQLARPVRPTEVFRFAAPCMGKGCAHFVDSHCKFATKVVRMLPDVVDSLPECDIRSQCRWFDQEGRAACLRCPQVVTDDVIRLQELALAVDPSTPVPD
jgi:hypothetical protein